MPISIVVGGQFGSEGKGKTVLELARRYAGIDLAVVRVGGPNSGHTAYSKNGRKYALRQMPAGCIDREVDVVFPAGAYIDVPILEEEIAELDYPRGRIFVSKHARILTEEHRAWEMEAGLVQSIGSTGSGVGAAVLAAVARGAANFPLASQEAQDVAPLADLVTDTTELLSSKLSSGGRVIIEGTQGFGLSLLDGGYWPKSTSRVTTAAGALSECGLSPLEVDDVTLVLRSFPIRVAGDSGPLVGETTWSKIAESAGRSVTELQEFTTVTKKLRRVGCFDAELVRRAIAANRPNRIVLNHLDYVGSIEDLADPESDLSIFVSRVESSIGDRIDWYGFSPLGIIEAQVDLLQ